MRNPQKFFIFFKSLIISKRLVLERKGAQKRDNSLGYAQWLWLLEINDVIARRHQATWLWRMTSVTHDVGDAWRRCMTLAKHAVDMLHDIDTRHDFPPHFRGGFPPPIHAQPLCEQPQKTFHFYKIASISLTVRRRANLTAEMESWFCKNILWQISVYQRPQRIKLI